MFRAIVGAILFVKYGIPLILIILSWLLEHWYIPLGIILLLFIIGSLS